MFKTNKIEFVNYYVANNQHLIIKDKFNSIIFNSILLEENVKDDIILTADSIFYNKNGINIIELESLSKSIIQSYSILNPNPMNCNIGIVINDNNEKLNVIKKQSLKLSKFNVVNYEWGLIYVTDSNILINNRTSLQVYTLKNKTFILEFDTVIIDNLSHSEMATVEILKVIGCFLNKIILGLNNNTIVSLDIITGNILYKWDGVKEDHLGKFNNKLPPTNSFVLDEITGVIFSLFNDSYIEIDLKTNSLNSVNLKNSFNKNNIDHFRFSTGYAFDDTHIYSIAQEDYIKLNIDYIPMCILALNRSTMEIDWKYTFEGDSILTDIPQLKGNKLYQLSALKTLYIFEKKK